MKSDLIQRLVTGRYSTRVFDLLFNWGLDSSAMRLLHCRARRDLPHVRHHSRNWQETVFYAIPL